MPSTRGGLVPAALINLNTNERVNCMFNPNEYTITKNNSWERKETKGKNVPAVTFKQGGSQTLKLQLLFDTYAEGTDVRLHTDMIWKMMAVDETKKNPKSGKSDPPMVAFEWGKLYFKAVITSLSQKFTLFLQDGTPVRTTVDITLEQLIDEDDYRPQPAGATPASDSTVVTTTSSDRPDTIAAEQTGDPANQRQIMEANNIDNPKKIPPGTPLNVPK
jgi:hypothetical protein